LTGATFGAAVGVGAVLVAVELADDSSATSDRRRNGLLDHVEQARAEVVVHHRVHPVAVHRTDEAEVQQEAERSDDREAPVDLAGDASLDGERELRTRLDGRRRDELEEERRLPMTTLPRASSVRRTW
jgi:hypothetical protein